MMEAKPMSKRDVIEISQEAERLLQTLATRHGLKVRFRGGRVDTPRLIEMRFSFETPRSGDPEAMPEAAEFIKFAHQFGLQQEDLGRVFDLIETGQEQQRSVQVIGLDRRNSAKPILVRTTGSGKLYRMAARRVVYALRANDTTAHMEQQ